jgi:hypothetical protein
MRTITQVALYAHDHPTAVQPIAFDFEFQLALSQLLFGGQLADGPPESTIPELDRASAVLPFGNRAFEVAVIERMIFNLDGEALVLWVQRRAARDGP